MEEVISEDEYDQELKVAFIPELYHQRRIWILHVLRQKMRYSFEIFSGPGRHAFVSSVATNCVLHKPCAGQ
jgi:hypothetical protein